MIGRGLNGSALGFFPSGSGAGSNTPASATVFDLREFESALLVVYSGSPNAVFNVQRSSTSNGNFAPFGASVTGQGSGIATRFFTCATSNVWHRVTFDHAGGSITYAAMLIGQGARTVPIEQQGNVTNYSDVAA